MMTHNNQILSSKTLCFINGFFFYFVEMKLEPCNFFNPPYLLEICNVMIFSSTNEMKSVAYHNILMSKICEESFQLE